MKLSACRKNQDGSIPLGQYLAKKFIDKPTWKAPDKRRIPAHYHPFISILHRSSCLNARQAGELRRQNPFMLDKHVEGFAHPFRVNQRFELEASADALHLGGAGLV